MTPYVEEMLSKPLNPETMDNDAAVKLMSIVIGGYHRDYIWGRSQLLKYYHDMTYEEWQKIPHRNGSKVNSWAIRLYFEAKEAILNDECGISGFVAPSAVIASWNREMERRKHEDYI